MTKEIFMDNIRDLPIKTVKSYLRNKNLIPTLILTNRIRYELNDNVKTYRSKKLYRGEKRNMLRLIKILLNKKERLNHA
jgi:hypothetical protein